MWSQEIALRTHRDNLEHPFVRYSNFIAIIAILKGFANIDDTLKNHLENGPKNAKICSAKIQSEIIACIARFVLMKIKHIVEEKKSFSIIPALIRLVAKFGLTPFRGGIKWVP